MRFAAAAVLAALAGCAGPLREMDVAEFREAFNAGANRARCVAIVSPT